MNNSILIMARYYYSAGHYTRLIVPIAGDIISNLKKTKGLVLVKIFANETKIVSPQVFPKTKTPVFQR
jgi:hypothetical protein